MKYTRRQELLYNKGVGLLKEYGKVSCALLRRKLSIGYEVARGIIDRMLDEEIATVGKEYTIIFDEDGANR